jgi:predicted phage gp36 major capsid-like protein
MDEETRQSVQQRLQELTSDVLAWRAECSKRGAELWDRLRNISDLIEERFDP